MQYKGKELVEFTSDKNVAFNPPKKMFVWDCEGFIYKRRVVAPTKAGLFVLFDVVAGNNVNCYEPFDLDFCFLFHPFSRMRGAV